MKAETKPKKKKSKSPKRKVEMQINNRNSERVKLLIYGTILRSSSHLFLFKYTYPVLFESVVAAIVVVSFALAFSIFVGLSLSFPFLFSLFLLANVFIV